jgi:SAM-dependent methyltransferase
MEKLSKSLTYWLVREEINRNKATLLMQSLKKKIQSQEIYTSICEYLPEDHSRAQSLSYYLDKSFCRLPDLAKVLDLGCGEGNSIDLFRALDKEVVWHGVDIENSPEVKRRIRENDLFSSFNGVDLPYSDNFFDLIYCHQVLEHVRHPDALISEAFRVLKPGGKFIGSVSYLEPYHSYSIFNFTPYGIVQVFGDAGFEVKEIRPAVDASMLINRQLLCRSKILRPIWRLNCLYAIIGLISSIFGLGHRERNFLKVQFSGHLVFLGKHPIK